MVPTSTWLIGVRSFQIAERRDIDYILLVDVDLVMEAWSCAIDERAIWLVRDIMWLTLLQDTLGQTHQIAMYFY